MHVERSIRSNHRHGRQSYSQRIFFNLHIPHAPLRRGLHLLFTEGDGEEPVGVSEAAGVGMDVKFSLSILWNVLWSQSLL